MPLRHVGGDVGGACGEGPRALRDGVAPRPAGDAGRGALDLDRSRIAAVRHVGRGGAGRGALLRVVRRAAQQSGDACSVTARALSPRPVRSGSTPPQQRLLELRSTALK